MKLCLVMLFTNELAWLKLHLSVYKDSFDGIVAITDPETTDGSIVYLLSLGAHVITRQWRSHWGEFATMAFNEAERLGYDAAMRLDPDECLMPDAGHEIKRLLTEEATLLVFPRYEFFGSRRTYRADMFPDHQARAWRLRRGITVQGARHEGVDFTFHRLYEGMPDPDYRVLRVSEPVIFHYGWSSPQAIWANQVKYQMHAQVAAGGPPEVNFPPGTPLVSFPTVPFEGAQPLDPGVVGKFAPFEEKKPVADPALTPEELLRRLYQAGVDSGQIPPVEIGKVVSTNPPILEVRVPDLASPGNEFKAPFIARELITIKAIYGEREEIARILSEIEVQDAKIEQLHKDLERAIVEARK